MTIDWNKDIYIKALIKLGCEVTPAGSRVTCSTVPETSDWDFLVCIPDMNKNSDVFSYLETEGFKIEGDSENYQFDLSDGFLSFRKKDINFIVTSDLSFAIKHRVATRLCKKLDVMDKSHRIAIFQAVLYGNVNDEIIPF